MIINNTNKDLHNTEFREFLVHDDDLQVLNDFIQSALLQNSFLKFLGSIANDLSYAYDESTRLFMPGSLLEETRGEEYDAEPFWGQVMIVEQDYAGGRCAMIRLDKFVFFIKLFSMYYMTNVNSEFDPWIIFRKLDKLIIKYSDYIYEEKVLFAKHMAGREHEYRTSEYDKKPPLNR